MTTATAKSKTEKRNEKLAGIYAQIETGIQNVLTSDKWQEWLQLQSRFYRYSYCNTILILAQYPSASFVAGFNRWNDEFKRKIKKGSKAIKILAPRFVTETKKDEETGQDVTRKKLVGFISVNVFDISQTEGDELPILCNELQGTSEPARLVIESLLKVIPCRISFQAIDSGAKGFYSHTENYIAVKEGMSDHQSAKTLAHEYAHYKMHRGNAVKERDRKEIEAESVAFIVCKYFGVDTDEYSFEYLASWSRGKDKDAIAKLCDGIQKTAAEIIDEISAVAPEILAAMEPAIEPTEVLPPEIPNTHAVVPAVPALPAMIQYSIALPKLVEQPTNQQIKPGRKVNVQWARTKDNSVDVVGYETGIPGLVVAQKPGVTRGGWMLLHTASSLTAFNDISSKKLAMFVAGTAVGTDWELPQDELTRHPENIEWYNRVRKIAYTNYRKPWLNFERLWNEQ